MNGWIDGMDSCCSVVRTRPRRRILQPLRDQTSVETLQTPPPPRFNLHRVKPSLKIRRLLLQPWEPSAASCVHQGCTDQSDPIDNQTHPTTTADPGSPAPSQKAWHQSPSPAYPPRGPRSPSHPPEPFGTQASEPRPPPSGSRCPLRTPSPKPASRGRARVAMATGVYFAPGTHSSLRSAPHPPRLRVRGSKVGVGGTMP